MVVTNSASAAVQDGSFQRLTARSREQLIRDKEQSLSKQSKSAAAEDPPFNQHLMGFGC